MDARLPLARLAACIGLATALAFAVPDAARAQAALRVEGTEFVLTTNAGDIVRGAELTGAALEIAGAEGPITLIIRSVAEDERAVGGRVFLYRFAVKDDAGAFIDMCMPDAEGRSLGFPVPDGNGGFDLTCTSGAVGKCIRWGYRPWEDEPGGPPLAALHQACVHMARADYGGDGRANTRAGTQIYWCDRFGVYPCGDDAPAPFEAAWGIAGATCVARPRFAQIVSLQQLGELYPRLRPRLGPQSCTQESALRDPEALLFNRSAQ
jgi:hypothetical protein